jgi:hypothetical protein
VFLLLVGLLFSLSAIGQPAFLNDGLVAYYPLNGNANNLVGSSGNGVANKTSPSDNHLGISGAAMEFNGVDSYIQAKLDSIPIGNSPWTASCWFKPNAANTRYDNFLLAWGIENNLASGSSAASLAVWKDLKTVFFWGSFNDFYQPFSLTAGRFYHITSTYNGAGVINIFVDGNLVGSKNVGSLKVNANNSNLWIGRSSNFNIPGLSGFTAGVIDTVRIYNRALSTGEINSLYNYELSPPIGNSFISEGLVADYSLKNSLFGSGCWGPTLLNPENISFKNGYATIDKSRGGVIFTGNACDIGGAWTVSFFVTHNGNNLLTTDNATIFSRSGMGANEFDTPGAGKGDGVDLLIKNGAIRLGVYSSQWTYSDPIQLPMAKTHVVIIENQSSCDLYLNGNKVVSVAGKPFSGTKSFRFGVTSWSNMPSFLMGLNSVKIYNRSLIDAEVKSLYAYEITPLVQPPVVLLQPQSQLVTAGNDATFCVTLGDGDNYNYQWQLNEQNIAGATLNCYTVNSVAAAMNGGRYRVIVSNSAGTVISDNATLTVATPPPPAIATQPVGKTVQEGSNVSFAVVASGQGALVYQWQLNEQNLPGATSATLNLNSVKQNQSGRYRVLVSSPYGVTISDTVTLTVNPNPPPTIVAQPIGKTVQEGANVSFNVVATGVGSITYQWQFNEQNVAGATGSTLNLNGVKLNTAGRYRVLVSSQYGVTISDTVSLIVNANPPPTIVTQPVSKTPTEGTQVSLTVTATGLGALTYQWQVNNQNIPGATSSTLVLSAVRPSANGNYRVIVGNPYGTTISTEATVTVVVTDADSDGLSDYEELLFGTNVNKADTDGDGLSDFAEVKTHGSNPLTTDTDGDGYSDGIEVARDGNPNNRSVTPTGALAVFPAVDVEFYTLNGVKYQLEVSTDMAVWTAQGSVVVGNGGSQNHLVRASKATQFWRLKVVQ